MPAAVVPGCEMEYGGKEQGRPEPKGSPVLSKRLDRILSMIRPGELLADIGTDHAYVPIAAVTRGLCRRALACDIVPGPLIHARENIAEAGLEEQIEVRQGDGLQPLGEERPDRIVIAGMGGPLMEKILTEGREKIRPGASLILSPQSGWMEFRMYLRECSFRIRREVMLEEDGKYYLILDCERESIPFEKPAQRPGELRYGDAALYLPEDLEVRRTYLRKELATAKTIEEQLKGNNSPAAETRCRELVTLIEDADWALEETDRCLQAAGAPDGEQEN